MCGEKANLDIKYNSNSLITNLPVIFFGLHWCFVVSLTSFIWHSLIPLLCPKLHLYYTLLLVYHSKRVHDIWQYASDAGCSLNNMCNGEYLLAILLHYSSFSCNACTFSLFLINAWLSALSAEQNIWFQWSLVCPGKVIPFRGVETQTASLHTDCMNLC